MKKLILVFLISLVVVSSFGQNRSNKNTVYLDENSNDITKSIFKTKTKAAVFYSRSFETDNQLIHKILYNYYFGKISPEEVNQIRLLLYKASSTIIGKGSNITIKYIDTLYGYKAKKDRISNLYFEHEFYTYKKHNSDKNIKSRKYYTEKSYNTYEKNRGKEIRKCIKTLKEEKNASAFYIYDENLEYNTVTEEVVWYKDPRGIFKKEFFKFPYQHSLLIIKPNGDYFMKYGLFPNEILYELLEEKDWSTYKTDWEKSIKMNSSKGFGIIKELFKSRYHSPNCY